MSTVTNSLAAVTDIVISIVMVVLLQRSKTGFKKTTDLVNKLVCLSRRRSGPRVLNVVMFQIIFTFNAGLPTSICALVAVVTVCSLLFVYLLLR